jgi:hypothetical protein
MDKIAKGMSQAGRHPQECCTRQEGLMQRMTHSFKGIAASVRHFLKGKEHPHSTSSR